jgi:hypothetical protein
MEVQSYEEGRGVGRGCRRQVSLRACLDSHRRAMGLMCALLGRQLSCEPLRAPIPLVLPPPIRSSPPLCNVQVSQHHHRRRQ